MHTNTIQHFLETAVYRLDVDGVRHALELGARVDATAYPLRTPGVRDEVGPVVDQVHHFGLISLLRVGLVRQREAAAALLGSQQSIQTTRAALDRQAVACLVVLLGVGLDPLVRYERAEFSACAKHAPMLFRALVRLTAHRPSPPLGGALHALLERIDPHVRDVAFVLKNGGNVHEADMNGNTPAHVLFQRAQPRLQNSVDAAFAVLCLLHERGADMMAMNTKGQTVEQWARSSLLTDFEHIPRADRRAQVVAMIAQIDAMVLSACVAETTSSPRGHKM